MEPPFIQSPFPIFHPPLRIVHLATFAWTSYAVSVKLFPSFVSTFRLLSWLNTTGGFHKLGIPQMVGLFHGHSHRSKWMVTRGTPRKPLMKSRLVRGGSSSAFSQKITSPPVDLLRLRLHNLLLVFSANHYLDAWCNSNPNHRNTCLTMRSG